MINTVPSYYKEFKCIADRCPDTCCAGWAVVVDPEKQALYRNTDGAFGEKLRRVMTVDADGDTVFENCNGRCPFLLESGLCEMYIETGESSLCRTCQQFPRFVSYFGAKKESGLSLSCPEAARLIMRDSSPDRFEEITVDEPIQPNSIDPILYFTLIKARKTAINIIQNRKYCIEERLCAFLRLCEAVQSQIRTQNFSGTEYTPSEEKLFMPCKNFDSAKVRRSVKRYFNDYLALEKLDKQWDCALTAASQAAPAPDCDCEQEHLAIYFIFRYFSAATFDRDLISKAKFAAVSHIIISRLLSAAQTKDERMRIMQRYSKEVEHSASNMDFLHNKMRKSRFYLTENLINILESQAKEK